MFEVVGVRPEILRKAKKVIVKKIEIMEKRVYIHMVYIDRYGRHDHVVSCDRSINPLVNILDALWCDCTVCSNFTINTKEWCRLKTRAAQELIKKDLWPRETERYIYGDAIYV